MTITNIEKREDEYQNESTFADIRFTRNDVKMLSYFLEESIKDYDNLHHLSETIKHLQRGFEIADKKMQECNLNTEN